MNKNVIPADGLQGLKENYASDITSGFIVFLLALPLSLGIAKASEFPPMMGLITAIVGGLLVSLFMGARLTIKGPAAGLIVIVAGAVADFGGGETGWNMACGVLVVSGIIQILFGIFKWGKLVDMFPLPAIHGMLAAIGLIIILKQFPVLLGVDPALAKGKKPFELIEMIPVFIQNLNVKATAVGIISFVIMFFWPSVKQSFLKKIPAPLLVLLIAIPVGVLWGFKTSLPPYAMVHLGNLLSSFSLNADFASLSRVDLFIKYLIMFSLVGSLESLLTVKAIDLMDPFKRKSDYNKDLIALGIGNTITALLGGLPMISEVARSSANVNNGAKTRWANFFHGFFILFFVLVGGHLIEMIPNSALAAMLVTVGIRLAHPKEFMHMFHIGKEQLLVFLVTIFFTLYEDLLVGIFVGMTLKALLHVMHGAPFASLFRAKIRVSFDEKQHYVVEVDEAAVFSNYIGIKNKLDEIPPQMHVTIDFTQSKFIDNSVLENLVNYKNGYERDGGTMILTGYDKHATLSNYVWAARKLKTV